MNNKADIDIEIQTRFLPHESNPADDRYVFAYTITITNQGEVPVKLLSRYWHISDANEKTQEIHGEGVVGQQPHLQPGQSFQYTSGAVIETAVGTMQGNYQLITDDGDLFNADIPAFTLADPAILH